MILMLQRGEPGALSIPGEIKIDDVHQCYTLENRADAIPPGAYRIALYDSPKFGRQMPLLLNVPGRSMIEIHWGDYPQNFEGCIGVGQLRDLEKEAIYFTRIAFGDLFPKIQAAVGIGDCSIQVMA